MKLLLPVLLIIVVARLLVSRDINVYGFISFWFWMFLGIVALMTIYQQNWSQTLLAVIMAGVAFLILFGGAWMQCMLEETNKF